MSINKEAQNMVHNILQKKNRFFYIANDRFRVEVYSLVGIGRRSTLKIQPSILGKFRLERSQMKKFSSVHSSNVKDCFYLIYLVFCNNTQIYNIKRVKYAVYGTPPSKQSHACWSAIR